MKYYSYPIRRQRVYRLYRTKKRKKKFIGRGILVVIFLSLVFLGANKACTPPDDAIAKYKKILEEDPTNIDVYFALGDAFCEKAENCELSEEAMIYFREAIGLYQRAIILDKDKRLTPESHYRLGLAYFKMSKLNLDKEYYEEAEKEFKLALKEGFENSDIHIYLGHLFFRKNAFDKAIKEYKRARELNPNDIPAWYNLGWVYKIKGLYNEAINAFQEVLSNKWLDKELKIKIYAILGDIYCAQNRLEYAKEEYKKLLKLDRNSVEAHYKLGCIYKKQGNIKAAENEWRRVLRIEPNHIEARNELIKLIRRG
jgi:tetratricopeptide (TPR) repeat protein